MAGQLNPLDWGTREKPDITYAGPEQLRFGKKPHSGPHASPPGPGNKWQAHYPA
jgi:hypothetical protein